MAQQNEQGVRDLVQQVFCASIGSLSSFQGEDWNTYEEILEQYFSANLIPEGRRVAVLITAIGNEAYKSLKDLCHPRLPKECTYGELCAILQKQYAPRFSVFQERTEFYELKQALGENVRQYYARIKSKASTCQFGNRLDDCIKDRLVCGLLKGPVKDRVMDQEYTAPLTEIVEAALRKEAALQATTAKGGSSQDVHRVDTKMVSNKSAIKVKRRTIQAENRATCMACGKDNHKFATCRYKQYICKICKVKGHLAVVCKEHTNKTNHLLLKEVQDFQELLHIDNRSNVPPYTVVVQVGKNNLEMEVDTGSAVSVIPSKTFVELFKGKLDLKHSKVRLKTYNGSIIHPVGEIEVEMGLNGVKARGRIIVVKHGCRPLLGRDLISVLKVNTVQINALEVNVSDKQVNALIQRYWKVFEPGLGKFKYEKVSLKISGEAKPMFIKPRPVPYAFKDLMNTELDRLEKEGVIELTDTNEWGTPLVPVLKGKNKIRICADYKVTINKQLEDIKYPLPRIEELFNALQGGEYFTKLDLSNAYNQLELDEESRKLVAWSTHRGIYVLNRLPYGTKPACSIFQKVVEKTLQGANGVINFLDDIVVTGTNRQEHLKNLEIVLRKLQEAGFKLNVSKCTFFVQEIKYLGHIIKKEGLFKDPEKVKAMREVPRPNNTSELKAFLGMINYYGKFINRSAMVLEPLYRLLKKDTIFKWSQKCEESFKTIKKVMSDDKNLAHFNPEIPIKLVCDASKIGIGSVLLHVYADGSEKPICFASRLLNKAEQGYAVIQKEALAIYWSVKKFYQYLVGNNFILGSDHKPLLAIFGEHKGIPQMAAGRLQRWALFLSGFNYTLQYIPGKLNGGADGLSRLPTKGEYEGVGEDNFNFLVEDHIPISGVEIKKAIAKDAILSKVVLYTREGWPEEVREELKPYWHRKDEIHLDKDILMWGYRVILPTSVRSKMLLELHTTHSGITRMKAVARQYVWWPNLDKDLESVTKKCEACRANFKNPPKAGLIKFETTKGVYERVHIDFLGPFQGKMFFVIIDAFSKWPEVYQMSTMTTKETLEKLRDCFSRFGLPDKIISDNGRQLVSEEFEQFCEKNGIVHITSAPYHPSTNGAAENLVKTFKDSLKRALEDKANRGVSLNTLISRYLFVYRNTPHCTTGDCPSQLMFGRKVKTRLDFMRKGRRETTENRQGDYFKGSRDVQFVEGERCLIKDYRGIENKWTDAIVIEVLGCRNYICKLVNENRVIWKRHIDQMLKCDPFLVESSIEEEQNVNREFREECIRETGNDIPINESVQVPTDHEQPVVLTDTKQEKAVSPVKDRILDSSVNSKVQERPRRNIKAPDRLNL